MIPYWEDWTRRWPKPSDLAGASPGEVIQAWGTLGYPRRALRLRQCAIAIATEHGDQAPADETTLRTLPGIGEYTAAAVAAFAYGQRTVVLDTNIRRVLSRAQHGQALPLPNLTADERSRAAALVPTDRATSVRWNQATMELGAVLCRARGLDCGPCPIKNLCSWARAGYPGDLHADKRKPQTWRGSNRQLRGQIMAMLRQAEGETVPIDALQAAVGDHARFEAVIDELVSDGLARVNEAGVGLP